MIADMDSIKEADNILLEVQGGVGKNIMATAVVRNLKKTYPDKKIIVMCGCPDVFLRNPNVYRAHHLGQPAFVYEDYFVSQKTIVVSPEPYRHLAYLTKKQHLVKCWCDMLDAPCDNTYPEIFLTENEQIMASEFLKKFDKEMVLFQGEGGKIPPQNTESDKIASKSGMYKRNLKEKIMEEVTDKLIERGFMVGVVCTPNQYLPKKAERINFQVRAMLALIPHVAEVIAIDSFLQHGVAMFKKRSLVVWGGTSPDVLGYDQNVNMIRKACTTPMCHRPNSYLWDFDSTGFLWDCPYNDVCMDYTSEDILDQFDKMTGGRRGKSRGQGKGNSCADKCKGIEAEVRGLGEGQNSPAIPVRANEG